MVNITLPDGDIKAFEAPLTGMDIAKGISEGLARDCVAMEMDDKLVDPVSMFYISADCIVLSTGSKQKKSTYQ